MSFARQASLAMMGVHLRLSTDVFEGDLLDDQLHGLGMRWNKDGKLLGCGKWSDGMLSQSRPVPRNKIKNGKFLSSAARGELLCRGVAGCVRLGCPSTHHHIFCSCRLRGAPAAPLEHTLLLPSGDHYIGEFNEGRWRPLGLGTEYRADGSATASGEWRNGELHGHGVKWNADRSLRQCGRFEEDELVESRAVPLSKVPADAVLNGNGQSLTEPAAAANCATRIPKRICRGLRVSRIAALCAVVLMLVISLWHLSSQRCAA